MDAELLVFVTNEENYHSYVSKLNQKPYFGESDKAKYLHHLGEVTETITYPIRSASINHSYKDIKGNCKVELDFRNIDLKYLFKGVQIQLILKATKDIIFNGFISEISYEQTTIKLTCVSFDDVLEKEAQCQYVQQKRSTIIEETIKEAGMIPVIDIEDLPDEIIDFTSIKQSGSKSKGAKKGDDCADTSSLCVARGRPHGQTGFGEDWDTESEKGIANENAPYYEWARSCSSDRAMLKELFGRFKYSGYYDNRDQCASQTYNNGGAISSNCADISRLVKACMDSRGSPCVIIHGTPYRCGHFWNIVKVNGSWQTLDFCYPVTSRGDAGGTNTSNILFE